DSKLVIATTPACDAAHALARWLEWGVDPERLSRVLRLAVSVVPVRRLCERCAQPHAAPIAEARRLGVDLPPDGAWRTPTGCSACDGTGYEGHLLLTDGISGAALARAFADRWRNGSGSIDPRDVPTGDPWLAGLRAVAAGRTTMADLAKALPASAVAAITPG
ncbi:MAG: hypothetical protein H6834_18710, partial [Planctomycetes bacterium]|nr:hypothetical protein [Planctomycetota bacterium]